MHSIETIRNLADTILSTPLLQGKNLAGCCYHIAEYIGSKFLERGFKPHSLQLAVALPLKGLSLAEENPYHDLGHASPPACSSHGMAAGEAEGISLVFTHGRMQRLESVFDGQGRANWQAKHGRICARILLEPMLHWGFHTALKVSAENDLGTWCEYVVDPMFRPCPVLPYEDWKNQLEAYVRPLSPSPGAPPLALRNRLLYRGGLAFMTHRGAASTDIEPPRSFALGHMLSLTPEYSCSPREISAPYWMHGFTSRESADYLQHIEHILATAQTAEAMLRLRHFHRSVTQAAIAMPRG